MIRPINHNQALLQQRARQATTADADIAQDLLATLAAHRAECVGMAANMIGQPVAIIVAQLAAGPVAMMNPVITREGGPFETEEGCLSLTGTRPTTRYRRITVLWHTPSGEAQTGRFTGFEAQIIQHECDHLKGILI